MAGAQIVGPSLPEFSSLRTVPTIASEAHNAISLSFYPSFIVRPSMCQLITVTGDSLGIQVVVGNSGVDHYQIENLFQPIRSDVIYYWYVTSPHD